MHNDATIHSTCYRGFRQNMDSIGGSNLEHSSEIGTTTSTRDEKMGAEAVDELLDNGWFFGKFLNSKPAQPKMLRCYSDLSPNINTRRDLLLSKNPHPQNSSPSTRKVRAPSLPPCIGMEPEDHQTYKNQTPCTQQKRSSHNHDIRRCEMIIDTANSCPPNRCFVTTPSLPPCMGKEDRDLITENESEITMSTLIHQAMPHSNPPNYLKGMPKPCRDAIKLHFESSSPKEITRHRCPNHRILKKSLSDLEVQSFRDFGFTFVKQDMNPSPVLQEKKKGYQDQQKLRRHRQGCADTPPIPVSAAKSSPQDMKAQIKFWARAVAFSVR